MAAKTRSVIHPSKDRFGRRRPRSPWLVLGLALGVLALGVLRHSTLAAETNPLTLGAGPRQLGQWVWTPKDAAHFDASQKKHRALVPALLVSSLEFDSGHWRLRRGIDPSATGSREIAVVVRLEDSVHEVWSRQSPAAVAQAIGKKLQPLLLELKGSEVEVRELQLDYDAPTRRLGLWAQTLTHLTRGPLRGIPTWVTSIPTHLSDPDYGARLRGVVEGHVIQLFDTGLECSDRQQARLGSQLAAHKLPYRIGVGAFERARQGGTTPSLTAHGCWVTRSAQLRDRTLYRGTWVFAANLETRSLFDRLQELR